MARIVDLEEALDSKKNEFQELVVRACMYVCMCVYIYIYIRGHGTHCGSEEALDSKKNEFQELVVRACVYVCIHLSL